MEWYVYYHDINKQKIVTFNIFDHCRFDESVRKSLKKTNDKDVFAKKLKGDLLYYFWAKCEYEVIITSFPTYITTNELDSLNKKRELCKEKYNKNPKRLDVNLETEIKIDVYSQVMNNWNVFLDYVWNNKKKRNKGKSLG